MKRVKIVLLLLLCASGITYSQVHLQVRGHGQGGTYSLSTRDSTYDIVLNEHGEADVILMEGMDEGYASLHVGEEEFPLYLDKTKKLNIILEDNTISFSGTLAPENQYLNHPRLKLRNINWNLPEDKFLIHLEECRGRLETFLETLHLSPSFVTKERKRLEYVVASKIIVYPRLYRVQTRNSDYQPGQAYYDFMESLVKDEKTILDAEEYQNMLNAFIVRLAEKKSDVHHDAYLSLKARIDYVLQQLKDTDVIAWVIHDATCEFIQYNGVGRWEELSPIYNQWVKDFKMRAKLDVLYRYWDGLYKGDSIPEFELKDIHDKPCRLSDFRGKFVYIDLWASWCIPCCEEIPYLKTLEEKFKGKDIQFVSISCDKDRNAWKKKVEKENLDGVLLIAENAAIKKFFKIKTIPRFILLDREGKIIDAMMTQPSNSETARRLAELL